MGAGCGSADGGFYDVLVEDNEAEDDKVQGHDIINPSRKSLSSVPSSSVRAYKISAKIEKVEKRVNCSPSILTMSSFITLLQVRVLSLGSRGGMR